MVGVSVGVVVTVGVGVGVTGAFITALIYTVCPVTHWVVADWTKIVVPEVYPDWAIPYPNTNPVPGVPGGVTPVCALQLWNAFVSPE